MDNNNQNKIKAASTMTAELNETNTMADSQPRPDEAMIERASSTDIAYPVNFRKVSAHGNADGFLSIDYEWDSSTGDPVHLSSCIITQHITHPFGAPIFSDQPPMKALGAMAETKKIQARDLSFTSIHGHKGFTDINTTTYAPVNFVSTVKFTWRQLFWPDSMPDMEIQMTELIRITRKAYPGMVSKWIYDCTDGSATATKIIYDYLAGQ